jgi:hypothetical protein
VLNGERIHDPDTVRDESVPWNVVGYIVLAPRDPSVLRMSKDKPHQDNTDDNRECSGQQEILSQHREASR